jgi:hypothetical protein
MITRRWQGVTVASKADAYLDYLHTTGVPDDQATAGNRGVYVLGRMEGSQAHFLLPSLWDSSEAIQRVSPLTGAKPLHLQFLLSC